MNSNELVFACQFPLLSLAGSLLLLQIIEPVSGRKFRKKFVMARLDVNGPLYTGISYLPRVPHCYIWIYHFFINILRCWTSFLQYKRTRTLKIKNRIISGSVLKKDLLIATIFDLCLFPLDGTFQVFIQYYLLWQEKIYGPGIYDVKIFISIYLGLNEEVKILENNANTRFR